MTIVVVAVMAVAGILSLLSVDLTLAIEARARAQTAADAAALAAAQEIASPAGSASPAAAAAAYAERNGAALASCSCAPSTAEATVTVSLPLTLVMLPARSVRASARAVIEPEGSTTARAQGGHARLGRPGFARGPRNMKVRRSTRRPRRSQVAQGLSAGRITFQVTAAACHTGLGGGCDDNHED